MTRSRRRYAVIPTRDRPVDFDDCVRAILPQVDALIVIAHCPPGENGQPYVWATLEWLDAERLLRGCQVIPYHEDPPNISRMWNLGLDTAPVFAAGDRYDVAVLNDDVIVPPDWFDRVTAAMRTGRNAAGCVYRDWDPRMTGYAFILDGDLGLRADEQFQWWFGDSDLQREAETMGGVAYAGGEDVIHRHPNSTTVGILAQIAEQDAIRYQAKWPNP